MSMAAAPPEDVVSGICVTDEPDEGCGMYAFDSPCSEVAQQHLWSGTCCSLLSTEAGGCILVIDGPESTCTWTDAEGRNSFTVEISESNDNECPPTEYAVVPNTFMDPATASPTMIDGMASCIADEPDDVSCGIYAFDIPCSDVAEEFVWSGTCCSLSSTENGGCTLTIDGPGSTCMWTWSEGYSSFTYEAIISESNENECPPTEYQVVQ
jgi:hypothetical protein